MTTLISDGNDGVYLKRTAWERAQRGLVGAFFALLTWMGYEAYVEVRGLHDSVKELAHDVGSLAEDTHANAEWIKAHHQWSMEQRSAIYDELRNRMTRDEFYRYMAPEIRRPRRQEDGR